MGSVFVTKPIMLDFKSLLTFPSQLYVFQKFKTKCKSFLLIVFKLSTPKLSFLRKLKNTCKLFSLISYQAYLSYLSSQKVKTCMKVNSFVRKQVLYYINVSHIGICITISQASIDFNTVSL